MDVSLEYIAMCKAVEEIQKQCDPVREGLKQTFWHEEETFIGDWFACRSALWHDEGRYQVEIVHHDSDENRGMLGEYGDKWDEIVWLPRQDQLQEIAGDVDSFTEHMAYHPGPGASASSKRWAVWNRRQDKWWATAEQAWLAFIMKEQYHKRWDGKQWVVLV